MNDLFQSSRPALLHVAILLSLAFASPVAHAQTTIFQAPPNGLRLWSDPSNWSNGLPNGTSNAIIQIPAVLDVDANVGSLALQDFASVTSDDRTPGSLPRSLIVSGTTTFMNPSIPGEIGAGGGSNFQLGTLANFSNGTFSGHFSVSDRDGTATNTPTLIRFHGADIITNAGHIQLTGPDAAIRDQDTGLDGLRNLAVNNNYLQLDNGIVRSTPGNFTNNADFYLDTFANQPITQFTVNGTMLNSGQSNSYIDGSMLTVTGDFNNESVDFNGLYLLSRANIPNPTTVTVLGNLRNATEAGIYVTGRDGFSARLIVQGNMVNSGYVSLSGIGSLEVGGALTVDGGEVFMNSNTGGFETFQMTAARIDLAAGTMFGARGTIFADLTDHGVFMLLRVPTAASSPDVNATADQTAGFFGESENLPLGSPPAVLTLNGDLVQADTAKLQVEIGPPGTGFIYLRQVTRATDTGTVLGGALAVSVANGFQVNNSDSFTIISSDRPLLGAFTNVASGGRISTSDGSGNFLVTYSGQSAVILSGFQTGPLALQFTGAISRKMHGPLGPFDVLLPLTGIPGVECRRSGGNHTLVFAFTNDIASGNVSVTAGAGTILGSPTFTSNTVTVNLTGVSDVQRIAVTLSNVTDTFAQVLPDTNLSVKILAGDVTGDGFVNSGDAIAARSRSGQPANGANFRSDVNTDGTVNGGDAIIVRASAGNSVP
ncbi:MAG: dockerin type I domain-containing protein [Chthoniobacterales bacterium]